MEFTGLDCCAFAAYILFVVGFAMYMSRKNESSEDYFLGGRKLTWWLIGISLIALNVSMKPAVGMAGAGFDTGLALASYEWTAAVAMVLVAIFLLPRFLRRGIYTIPEYLEARYSAAARGLMAFFMMVTYVLVIIAAVLYAGALGLNAVFGESVKTYLGVEKSGDLAGWLTSTPMQWIFGIDPSGKNWVIICAVWLIGIIAGIYTVWGGLKAVVWADLFNGLGLILGGVLVTLLGFLALSAQLGEGHGLAEGISIFCARAGDKLSAVRPWNDPEVSWIAVFIGGLWVLQHFYWGLNQSVTQRALGAGSLSQGQRGMTLAATLKLLMPLILIFPGIMAYELYAGQIADRDRAYADLIQTILPNGLKGAMFAVLFGAVISSLDSILNSASTILTMDLYKRHLRKDAADRSLITLGRVVTAVFVVLACLWAPRLGWIAGGKGIADYLQNTWGFIAPGIITVFLFGFFSRRTPAQAACGAMLLGIPLYAFFLWAMPRVAFLHHMAFTFIALCGYMTVVTLLTPLRDVEEPSEPGDAEPAGGRPGFLREHLIPYGTALLGACLIAKPIFYFSMSCWPNERFFWVHFIPAGVAVVLFFCAALFLLRRPAPTTRRVAARADRAPAAAGPGTPGRLLKFAVIGLVGTVILALHTYMFCWEIMKDRYRADYRYWQRSVSVALPWIQLGREAEDPGPAQPPGEEADPGQGAKDEPPGDEPVGDEPAGEAPAGDEPAGDEPAGDEPSGDEPGQPEPVEEEGVEGEEDGKVPIYLGPAAISLGMVLAFLATLVLVWRKPVRPEVETPAATDIDLTPSRLAKFWGIGVVVAVVVLYVRFF